MNLEDSRPHASGVASEPSKEPFDRSTGTDASRSALVGAVVGAAAGRACATIANAGSMQTAAATVLGGLAGFSYVKLVRQKYGIGRTAFSRLANLSERTLGEWERNEPGKRASLRPFHELDRLHEGLSRVVRPEHIPDWMDTPNPAFDGLTPIEVVERGQMDRLWRMIYEMEVGSAY